MAGLGTVTVEISPEDSARLLKRLEEQNAELAALRLIVTEKFAGADMHVKPEDAADVATWAANPGAVRELLKYDPVREEYDQEACAACSEVVGDYPTVTAHLGSCTVAAAWRALGDPRGAADIERAHEEGLREQSTRLTMRMQRDMNGAPVTGSWVGHALHDADRDEMVAVRLSPCAVFATREATLGPAPFRLASETHQAAQSRMDELARIGRAAMEREGIRSIAVINDNTQRANMALDFAGVDVMLDERLDPDEYRLHRDSRARPFAQFGVRAWVAMQRSVSDARDMEAVEEEARRSLDHGATDRSVGRDPHVP